MRPCTERPVMSAAASGHTRWSTDQRVAAVTRVRYGTSSTWGWRTLPVGGFFSPVSRAGLSTCPGGDLPGQLDGLLRASLPGKTVTGQDPASFDRLDLSQRGQGPIVILVQEPGEQLRPGLAVGKAERRQRVAHDQDLTVGQAQGRVSGGVAGRVDDPGAPRH